MADTAIKIQSDGRLLAPPLKANASFFKVLALNVLLTLAISLTVSFSVAASYATGTQPLTKMMTVTTDEDGNQVVVVEGGLVIAGAPIPSPPARSPVVLVFICGSRNTL